MEAAHTPLHIFFLPHHTNFPDVAATRNKQLNEHLSAGDSHPVRGSLEGVDVKSHSLHKQSAMMSSSS